MNKNDKRVPDCVHDAVMEALSRLDEVQGDTTKRRRVLPLKRIAAIALAAALCLTMMVTAFAYGDEILAAIFKRRKELVEDKTAVINKTVSAGEILLSADSVTVQRQIEDDLFLDIQVSIHKEAGTFENGINCRAAKIEMLVKDDMELYNYNMNRYQTGEWYIIYAYDRDNYNCNPNMYLGYDPVEDVNQLYVEQAMHSAGYGLGNETNRIDLMYKEMIGRYTDYRITYYDLTSYDGTVKYADEISVEFSLEAEAAPLTQLDMYEPEKEFELEGFIYQLQKLDMTASKISVTIRNKDMETFSFNGEDCLAINLVSGFGCSPEYVTTLKEMDRMNEEYSGRVDELWENEEYIELLSRNMLASIPTEDQSILDICYELAADLDAECGAEVIGSKLCDGKNMSSNREIGDIEVTMSMEFSSPIYVGDIKRLYLRKIGDPNIEVTIWVPSEDEKLPGSIGKVKYDGRE